MTARLTVAGRTYRGRAIDLRGRNDVDVAAVFDALGVDSADPFAADPLVAVTASPPPLRRALAAAARSHGHTAPQDDRIAELNRELAELGESGDADDRGGARSARGARGAGDAAGSAESSPRASLRAARERVADAGADVERLRERAATLRGRLIAARDAAEERPASDGADRANGDGTASDDVAAAEAALTETVQALTTAETDRVAAEQALTRAAERMRAARDARERRLRLTDARGNRRREARAALARAVYPAFAAATRAVPGAASPGAEPGEWSGDPVAAQLGAVRVADRGGPVVLAVRRFDSAAGAADCLGTPVILV
ncbi:hypothetical protein [Halobaculum sp. P14]|uniref:DUF7856 family protein n=1 Tax=Halobaculum sp. P14 TaxID=3421638 RepID=UPI003EB7A214